ncbi:hypothetical protein H6P81_000985 [Aristolochia fimbriata]|uniref:Uncharacterized protein n=1 Tax=Aristolochia fimbriata TaxID=158543 RepID=A0AAV7F8X8_ARIFI|nr:hypothetical protein H6P81_000985 [Aristolochia fimbriata]
MDSPHRSFSLANKSSSTRRFSSDSQQVRPVNGSNREEIDENQPLTVNDGALKPQFQKKVAKNFMAPTISAASKVSTPRKKILAERNECFGSACSERLAEVSPASGPLDVSARRTPLSSKISQSDDADSSSAPYDPLTNYLSPRPRFLRYNPNRRLEFLRSEKLKQELGLIDGSPSPESTTRTGGESPSPSYSGVSLEGENQEEQEDRFNKSAEEVVSDEVLKRDGDPKEEEEEEEEEGDEEEEDERRCSRGRAVIQCVLVLSLLFFGLRFLSSTYPSSLLSYSQQLGGPDQGFLEFHDPLPFLRKSDLNNFSDQFLRLFRELSTFIGSSIFSTSKLVPFTEERTLSGDPPPVLTNEDNLDLEVVTDFPDEERLSASTDAEEASQPSLPNDQDQSIDLEVVIPSGEELTVESDSPLPQSVVTVEASEFDQQLSAVIPLEEDLTVDSDTSPLSQSVVTGEANQFDEEATVVIPLEEELTVDSDSSPLFQDATGEASEFDDCLLQEDDEESTVVTEVGDEGGVSDEGIDELELTETKKEITDQVTDITEQTEMSGLSESPILPSDSVSEAELLPHSISVRSSVMESTAQITESTLKAIDMGTIPETKQISWTEYLKEKSSPEAALAVSLLFLLATSITFVFLRLKAAKKATVPSSSPSTPTIQLQGSESTALEKKKMTSEWLEKEDNEVQNNSHIDLSPSAQPLPADDFSPLYSTRPPTVELLGEFEVGEQVDSSGKASSSLRSKRASRSKSAKVSENAEKEYSRASISFSSNKVKSSVPELSTAESLSYGSFIVQGKLVKKQEGEAGVSVVTTPVRRSSRIRHRVMSP